MCRFQNLLNFRQARHFPPIHNYIYNTICVCIVSLMLMLMHRCTPRIILSVHKRALMHFSSKLKIKHNTTHKSRETNKCMFISLSWLCVRRHRINYACDWGKPKYLARTHTFVLHVIQSFQTYRKILNAWGYVSIAIYFISFRLSHIAAAAKSEYFCNSDGYCAITRKKKFLFNNGWYGTFFYGIDFTLLLHKIQKGFIGLYKHLHCFYSFEKTWIFYLAVISWFVSFVE